MLILVPVHYGKPTTQGRRLSSFVPSRLSESSVTQQYYIWCKSAQNKKAIGTRRNIEVPLPHKNKKTVDNYKVAGPAPTYHNNSSSDMCFEMQEQQDFVNDTMHRQ